jgi:hypothetical protein
MRRILFALFALAAFAAAGAQDRGSAYLERLGLTNRQRTPVPKPGPRQGRRPHRPGGRQAGRARKGPFFSGSPAQENNGRGQLRKGRSQALRGAGTRRGKTRKSEGPRLEEVHQARETAKGRLGDRPRRFAVITVSRSSALRFLPAEDVDDEPREYEE